jgi:uncharacterized Fe-S cluster protein YjdI
VSKQHEFSNGELTVIWQPGLCVHSAKCVGGLPDVFRPGEKPWIKIDAANSDAIEATVKNCPSGALTCRREQE